MEQEYGREADLGDPETCRESGKLLYFCPESGDGEKERGLQLMLRALRQGDCEAKRIIGQLLVEGKMSAREGTDSRELGMTLLWDAARAGEVCAGNLLESYCKTAYREKVPRMETDGPLRDFSGQIIQIGRKGLLTPVDAVLSYENGKIC